MKRTQSLLATLTLLLALLTGCTSGMSPETPEQLYSVLPASRYEPVATSDEDTSLYRALDENGQQIGWCAIACRNGYVGPVAVTLGIDMEGFVVDAVIGDEDFWETAGFGQKWRDEPERLAQFRKLHVVYGGEIDVIVNATVTSNAVLDATNAALESVAEVSGIEIENAVVLGLPKLVYETTTVVSDGALSVSCRGFASTVTAHVTLDDRGCIESLVLDTSGETSIFGALVMEDSAFISQFIGKAGPFTAGVDVDVHSSATVTSNAVIVAINSLFTDDTTQVQPTVEQTQPAAADGNAFTASAMGLLSEVTVTVTLDDAGAIATISVDCSGEIPAISGPCAEEPFLSQFVGRVGPFDDIEIVTGATVTSNAVIEAVNSLFPDY